MSVNFPGAKRPLEEGAKLGWWQFVLLEGSRVNIPPTDCYIFAAWSPYYSHLMSLGRIGILWTSSLAEMEFTPIEQAYLNQILSDPRISFVWFGDRSLAQLHPEKGFYAPYPLDPFIPGVAQVQKEDYITLFCPTKLSKNIHNQLCAVALLQKERKLTLYTNVPVSEDIEHVPFGWVPQEQYHQLVARARVNLAVSWAETFHYGCAEAALLGTASVVSPALDWYPIPALRVKNPNNPLEIKEKILFALDNPELGAMAREGVIGVAEERNAIVKEKLSVLDKTLIK